ncbi:MAG: UDP-N-acetylglucosamine 2-epimerase [Candidatus Rokuibacteriota bacterium]
MTGRARRRVGVVTVSRSDWGHILPVLEEIRRADDLELVLLVAGMHLEPVFGLTVRDIEAAGWRIAGRVPMDETDDSPRAIAASTARGVEGFARCFESRRSDLLVVLGDRFEMLAAAAAALPFVIPVAHIHGGEESQGATDNQIRHAITKLAHLHFASAETHAGNLRRLGEEPWRIHTVGAPGLDRVRTTARLGRDEVARAVGLPERGHWILVTFHPVTLQPDATAGHVDALLRALDKVDAPLVVTYPNADTAGRTIIERIEEFAARHPRCRLVRSLGERLYLSLLAHADVMVGNSSSGLIEAPSFALPVVNVGARQQGRLRGVNVIDVEPDADAILGGIEAALAPGFRDRLRDAPNPYGDGGAAPRIVRVLREVALDARLVEKRFLG